VSDSLTCPDCFEHVEVLGLGIGSADDCDDAMDDHRDKCPARKP
jgi:hypothetical protein